MGSQGMKPMEDVLLSLHRSPAHNAQVEAWRTDEKAFEKVRNDHEDELKRVRGEAYQVASLYALFQTVLLSAVAQASRLSCAHWWSPVSLSIAVCVASYLAIADKLYSMGELQEDINEIGSCISGTREQLDLVEEQGADLDLETAQPEQRYQRDDRAGFRSIVSGYGIAALVFLTSFSALIACFSTQTLCRHCTSPTCSPP